VTAALEAEAKQISDLTKERDGLKAAAAKSAIAAHGGQRTLGAESWEALLILVPNVWFRVLSQSLPTDPRRLSCRRRFQRTSRR
jgi:hypothetical protein